MQSGSFGRILGKPRFAGEALNVNFGDGKGISPGPFLSNPQIGLIKSPSAIRSAQKPGGNLVETETEKFFERPR